MSKRDVLRIERQMLALSRHPSMGAFSQGDSAPEHLERSAYLLLSRIDETGPMSIKELTEAFRLDTSTINRHTAAMLRAGLVERIPDPDGGMARKFRISAHGAEVLQEHRGWVVGGLTRVLAEWTDDEFDELARSLEHLTASIASLQQSSRRGP